MLLAGCGNGLFLETMLQAGFRVTGQESDPLLLSRARMRLGQAAGLNLGPCEHLSYEDNSFDYLLLLFALNRSVEPDLVLQEAARVARRGILVGMLNRWPRPTRQESAFTAQTSSEEAPLFPLSWGRLKKMIRSRIAVRQMRARSVLPGPQFTWRDSALANLLNRGFYPADWGAFYAVRMDLPGEAAALPLGALSAKPGIA